jgi:hypothetical protein
VVKKSGVKRDRRKISKNRDTWKLILKEGRDLHREREGERDFKLLEERLCVQTE